MECCPFSYNYCQIIYYYYYKNKIGDGRYVFVVGEKKRGTEMSGRWVGWNLENNYIYFIHALTNIED